MKLPFHGRETGTSLVELIIAASILAMIGYFASTFFRRVDTSDAAARARSYAISESGTFLETIERDFKMRDIVAGATDLCTGGGSSCRTFNVTRKVCDTSNNYQDMQVTYRTVCRNIDAVEYKQGNAYEMSQSTINSRISGNGDKAIKSSCIIDAGCKAGQYAAIEIAPNSASPGVSNAKITGYPRLKSAGSSGKKISTFPDFEDVKSSFRKGVVGAAICGANGAAGQKSDRVVIETAVVNAEGKMNFVIKEVSIPRSNVAKIQLLPGCT